MFFLFFTFKPHKRIALHQIHNIMFFLATSYDLSNHRWAAGIHLIFSQAYLGI